MSDFPEFDRAYKTVLVKDLADRFEQLAAEANFNVYHSDIWRGSGRRFAELIVRECADVVASRPYIDDGDWPHPSAMIKQHFGVKESKREKFRKSFEEAFKGGVDLSGQETP